MKEKIVISLALIFWLTIASLYFFHTPPNHRSHDFIAHVEYTILLSVQKQFPHPYEAWETFQPPLYYLINSLLLPPVSIKNAFLHINLVSYVSLLYGLIALFIIYWLLRQTINNLFVRLLVLLFIGTTPNFVFLFSTYNNDSLATLLLIATFAIAYKLITNWSYKNAILLLLILTAGLYTKNTALAAITALCIYFSRNFIRFKLPDKTSLKILIILFLALSLFFPWTYFHNYKNTDRFFPTNVDNEINTKFNFELFDNVVGIIFRIPDLQINKPTYQYEWDVPWVYPDWGIYHPSSKRYDYFGFSFITSIIGEYVFKSPYVIVIWIILYIHLIVTLFSLFNIPNTPLGNFSKFILITVYLLQISTLPLSPYLPQRNMDYRYIAWLWAPWAVINAYALDGKYKLISLLLQSLVICAIAIQVYTLLTVKGGFWI